MSEKHPQPTFRNYRIRINIPECQIWRNNYAVREVGCISVLCPKFVYGTIKEQISYGPLKPTGAYKQQARSQYVRQSVRLYCHLCVSIRAANKVDVSKMTTMVSKNSKEILLKCSPRELAKLWISELATLKTYLTMPNIHLPWLRKVHYCREQNIMKYEKINWTWKLCSTRDVCPHSVLLQECCLVLSCYLINVLKYLVTCFEQSFFLALTSCLMPLRLKYTWCNINLCY